MTLIKRPIYFDGKISVTGRIVCGMFICLPAIKQIMCEKVGIQNVHIHFTLFLKRVRRFFPTVLGFAY